MKPAILFVTGSDTGVGKTIFAALLTRHLFARGFRVVGLKPICSGDRADAQALRAAAGKVRSLDEVNPWHFRAAIAPLLAARREQRRVRLRAVVDHIRHVARSFDWAVVEGAGGLLSPLGEGFDSRDLLRALPAVPLIVCANRLGAVNQALLVLSSLPRAAARRAQIVLMAPERATVVSRTNLPLLRELARNTSVHELPHLSQPAPRARIFHAHHETATEWIAGLRPALSVASLKSRSQTGAPPSRWEVSGLDAALRRASVRRTLDAVLREIDDGIFET